MDQHTRHTVLPNEDEHRADNPEIVELDMQLDAKGKVEAYRAKVRLSFKVER
jgi:hypothetical protein